MFEAKITALELQLQGRFDQLELALLAYHDEHGTFPPTKYQAEDGGPTHSWRVLLVPYTGGGDGYSEYDFSQEWNSTNNLRALDNGRIGSIFREDEDSPIATILAVGEDGQWPSDRLLKSRLVRKGKDRFLLVEDPESEVHWMEPKY